MSAVEQRATERAASYSKSNGFRGAFRRGYLARVDGEPSHRNPYDDLRTSRGGITYSRAFMRAWYDGWTAAEAEVNHTVAS